MLVNKPVNTDQLQAEALALGGHVSISVNGGTLNRTTGIVTGATDLFCCDVLGSSALQEPCASATTAYKAHVAASSIKGNPNQKLIDAMKAVAANDPGYNVAQKVIAGLS